MTSYSQAGQDLFAFIMTEGKQDGFYLDIGCNHPSFHSNTYGLEELGWTGLLVDVVDGCESRKGTFVKCDASKPDERLLFQYDQMPPVVDYLSLDVDDALVPVMAAIPFNLHTFRVITLEHDSYCRGPSAKFSAWERLRGLGYRLVCENVKVVPPGLASPESFEDWYVWPDLVNPELVSRYMCACRLGSEIVK